MWRFLGVVGVEHRSGHEASGLSNLLRVRASSSIVVSKIECVCGDVCVSLAVLPKKT